VSEPDPDVELVRELTETFSLDMPIERFAAAFDPAYSEVRPLRADLEGGMYRGRDAPAQFLAALREAWEELSFELLDVRRVGDVVLFVVRLRALSRDTHVEIVTEVGLVARLSDGRITRMYTYRDPADAVAAAQAAE
jgi:ketosteroid isomerase-like protein